MRLLALALIFCFVLLYTVFLVEQENLNSFSACLGEHFYLYACVAPLMTLSISILI